jgi:hypothetical protein
MLPSGLPTKVDTQSIRTYGTKRTYFRYKNWICWQEDYQFKTHCQQWRLKTVPGLNLAKDSRTLYTSALLDLLVDSVAESYI